MKKLFIVMLALFLAVPAVTYAGSATSRWDLTIGGFVKFDMMYADQALNTDNSFARRKSVAANENFGDEYGSTSFAAGETRMNFAIKGPDIWDGAKTSAFIEWEASGAYAAGMYGGFRLRHAFMKFDWPKSNLIIGQTWEDWAIIFPDVLGRTDFTQFRRGTRAPQIRWTQMFTKEWKAFAGIYSPRNVEGAANNTADANNISKLPHFMGEISWATPACGVIGPNMMMFGAGGFWGKQKITAAQAVANRYADDDVNAWSAGLKGFIPIIPEKKGNKAGALFLKGQIAIGQGYGMYYGGINTAYDTDFNANNVAGKFPTATTGYAQLGYYITNQVWANVVYGAMTQNISARYAAANANVIRNYSAAAFTMFYDPNPAVRFGFEYMNVRTGYAGFANDAYANVVAPGAGVYSKSGEANIFRVSAYYFF